MNAGLLNWATTLKRHIYLYNTKKKTVKCSAKKDLPLLSHLNNISTTTPSQILYLRRHKGRHNVKYVEFLRKQRHRNVTEWLRPNSFAPRSLGEMFQLTNRNNDFSVFRIKNCLKWEQPCERYQFHPNPHEYLLGIHLLAISGNLWEVRTS